MIFTTDSAKQFLLSKLKERAGQDRVALDDIEQRMFLFSESNATPDFEAQEKFDRDYDANAYEAKVTKLLRESYAHDKHIAEASHEWAEALKALGEEDFYGLVMVDQAKISRPTQAGGVCAGWWPSALGMLPFAVTELAVIGIAWFVVFHPHGIVSRLPDWLRLILLPVFFWLIWYVGKVFGQVGPSKRA